MWSPERVGATLLATNTTMSQTPMYEQIELSYEVTEDLSIDMVEICNWRPDFPACAYCGDNEYWNIVWATGLAVSRYLATAVPADRIRGRKTLVVGCGVGLESVLLAKLGAQVSALDHVADALTLVKYNCELNDVPAVQTLCACLHDPDSVQKLGTYDLLVGGDVHYEPENARWVKALLTTVLKPNGLAVFGDPFREGVDEFFEGLDRAAFQVTASHTRTPWISEDQDIRIHQIERR